VVLVTLTIGYMLLQNFTGMAVASGMGLDRLVGLLGGSVSLLGGHGTSIAWAPTFAQKHGIPNASEIGIACATPGLVISSLMGGPIARFLITRHRLEPKVIVQPDVGVTHDSKSQEIDYYGMLGTLFWLNMSLALGGLLQTALHYAGARLPLFVCSLFAAILLTNTVPRIANQLQWPAGTRSLALVSDVSLGVFLAMSLMSLQLWTIVELAGSILAILAAQTLLAVLFALFVIFPCMGRDYEAAVVCSGFAGISLGATPTAMANITAVAKKYGQAHRAHLSSSRSSRDFSWTLPTRWLFRGSSRGLVSREVPVFVPEGSRARGSRQASCRVRVRIKGPLPARGSRRKERPEG